MGFEGKVKAEVVKYFLDMEPGCFSDGQMPTNEKLVRKIFEKTGWEMPYRRMAYSYIGRFWRKYIVEPRNEFKPKLAPIIENAEAAQFARRRDFYETQQWRSLRYERLKLSGRRCSCCGAAAGAKRRDGGVVVVHVDHIKSRSRFPDLCLTLENTQVLCEDCNIGKGSVDHTDFRVTTDA